MSGVRILHVLCNGRVTVCGKARYSLGRLNGAVEFEAFLRRIIKRARTLQPRLERSSRRRGENHV